MKNIRRYTRLCGKKYVVRKRLGDLELGIVSLMGTFGEMEIMLQT